MKNIFRQSKWVVDRDGFPYRQDLIYSQERREEGRKDTHVFIKYLLLFNKNPDPYNWT